MLDLQFAYCLMYVLYQACTSKSPTRLLAPLLTSRAPLTAPSLLLAHECCCLCCLLTGVWAGTVCSLWCCSHLLNRVPSFGFSGWGPTTFLGCCVPSVRCDCRPGGAPPPRRQSRGYGAPQGGYDERPAPEMRPGGHSRAEQCQSGVCLSLSLTLSSKRGSCLCDVYFQMDTSKDACSEYRSGPRLRPLSHAEIELVYAGDWMCPDCSAHNFASKVECYRCSSPRYGS